MQVALAANPNAELLVSGGDQVETAGTESQWNAFLAPNELRSYPWVATIGNHDVGSKAYEQHFWTPNTNRSLSYYTTGTNRSGGDYWFIYKGVLFINLNSNAYLTSAQAGVDADAAHIAFVTDVITQHGAEAKYTVLVYHHSIYSPADHANDGDNKERRKDFPTAFSNLGVDLVLQGHDHSYSRSYLIDNGVKQKSDEQPGATSVFKGPGGVVYVTGNSASGSKYYDITAPNTAADPLYGPDPLNPSSHWANSVQNQEHVRNYVKVLVRNNLLSVENIRSGTCAAPNSAVELRQESWCGPNNGASPALPVGSLVDKVFIVNDAAVQVTRSGVVRDRRTGMFTQQLTITNNTGDTVAGAVGVWLEGLSGNATLANASGPANYIVVPGTGAGLAMGSSATVNLQFLNPTNAAINDTPHVQAAATSAQ
ncbi:MAG: metallophosphoesterase [Vicinamibacterales bacterium]